MSNPVMTVFRTRSAREMCIFLNRIRHIGNYMHDRLHIVSAGVFLESFEVRYIPCNARDWNYALIMLEIAAEIKHSRPSVWKQLLFWR